MEIQVVHELHKHMDPTNTFYAVPNATHPFFSLWHLMHMHKSKG